MNMEHRLVSLHNPPPKTAIAVAAGRSEHPLLSRSSNIQQLKPPILDLAASPSHPHWMVVKTN